MTARRGVRAWGTACAAAVLCAFVVEAPARADDGDPAPAAPIPEQSPPTRRHLELHAGIDLSLGVVYFLSETALKPTLTADECRWCTPPPFDAAIRDALVWQHTNRANLISDFTGYVAPAAIGLGALYVESRDRHDFVTFLDDSLAVVDVAIAVGIVNQATKFAVGRARPLAYYAPPDRMHDTDDNTSFFSGHTALAFGVTFAAGRVAERHGYRSAPWILGAGIAMSTVTAYLRMAADKHYMSDVLVGAAFGSAVGWVLPGWLHAHGVTVAPAPNGIAVLGTF
jgi:membrane-associated phospholipid phosphatase